MSAWDKRLSEYLATVLAIFSGVGLVISVIVHAVPSKRDDAILWGLFVSVNVSFVVGSLGMSWGFWVALAIMMNVLLMSNHRFETGFMDSVFNVLTGFLVVYCEQWNIPRFPLGTLVLLAAFVMWQQGSSLWRVRFTSMLMASWGLWCWAEALLRADASRSVIAILSLFSGWTGCPACGIRDFRIAVVSVSGPLWSTWLLLVLGGWALWWFARPGPLVRCVRLVCSCLCCHLKGQTRYTE